MILLAESDLFVFIHQDNRLEPMIYFRVASFGTFVSRTLPYTAYRCTVFFCFFCFFCCFFQQFPDSFVCRSDERMTKCKSVNLLFFSPCLCCSNRKRVQLNMFSLSSLISRIRKSVIRCLQNPISFSPFN